MESAYTVYVIQLDGFYVCSTHLNEIVSRRYVQYCVEKSNALRFNDKQAANKFMLENGLLFLNYSVNKLDLGAFNG